MLALFVDTSNLYFCVGKRFTNRKLDYQRLWERVSDFGSIFKAFAYGIQMKSEAANFIACLEKIGFETKYKYSEKDSDWRLGMTLDIVRLAPRINTVVICSADIEMLPTIIWLREQHMRVHLIACSIPNELKEVVNSWIEISEELLEVRGLKTMVSCGG